MTLPPRLLSGTAVSVLGRVLGTVISVVTIGVITRGLAATAGVAGYGEYATVMTFLLALAVLADGGLYLVFTRHAAVLSAAAEAVFLQRTLRVRLLLFLVVGAAVAVVVTLLRYPLPVRVGMLLGAAGVAAQLAAQLTLGVFQKRLRMVPPAAAEVAGRTVTLLVAVGAAAAGGGLLAYVLAFVVGALTTLTVNLLGARRLLRESAVETTAPSSHLVPHASTLVREAWPLALMLVFWMVVFRADSLLLSYLKPPADLAWYALPYRVLESLLFFPAMIGGLLLPIFSRLRIGSEDPAAFRTTLDQAVTLFLLLAIPTSALLFFLAPVIIGVLGGPAFTPSIPILRILAVALGFLFFGTLFGSSLVALGAQRQLLLAAATLAAGNVLTNLLVIPRWSSLGAAWTTLATEGCSALWAYGILRHALGPLPRVVARWHIVSSGVLFVFFLLLPLPIVFRAVGGIALYLVSLLFFGVLTPANLKALLRTQRLARAEQLP